MLFKTHAGLCDIVLSALQAENLHAITDCVCPGDVVTYECTVCGGLVTVWGGSAFQCAKQEIILSNRRFGTSAWSLRSLQ